MVYGVLQKNIMSEIRPWEEGLGGPWDNEQGTSSDNDCEGSSDLEGGGGGRHVDP